MKSKKTQESLIIGPVDFRSPGSITRTRAVSVVECALPMWHHAHIQGLSRSHQCCGCRIHWFK